MLDLSPVILQIMYSYFFFFLCLFLCGTETMLWKEKERSRIKTVQMDNLNGLLGVRRMDRVQKARIRELCELRKGLDERIDEGVLLWRGIRSPSVSM